jgi:hypothetical protein
MKKLRNVLMGTLIPVAATTPAFAVDTTKTYSSGILVGVFLGFCALIVVVQLMPAIMMLIGFVKGLLKGQAKRQTTRS